MSPKTFKNKKESNDSKRPGSGDGSGSAPFSSFVDFSENDPTLKVEHDVGSPTQENDAPVPPLRQDSDDENVVDGGEHNRNKVTGYFDRYAKAVIKVFSSNEQILVFPMFIKNFIDAKGYFESIRVISNYVCDMVDSELERIGYFPFFAGSFQYEHGYACDLRIESVDQTFGNEINLHQKNYEDLFVSTYLDKKILHLNVHVKENILHPKKSLVDDVPAPSFRVDTPRDPVIKTEDNKNMMATDNVRMFRG
jgi:hypothetical protein